MKKMDKKDKVFKEESKYNNCPSNLLGGEKVIRSLNRGEDEIARDSVTYFQELKYR